MRTLIPLAALVPILLAGQVRAQLPPGPGPVVGPVEIAVQSGFATAKQGGFGEAQIAVLNHSSSTAVHVVIQAWVRYADGTKHVLQLGPGQTLPPGLGVVLVPLFAVPPNAALGEATIVGRVFVTRVTNTTLGHFPRPHVAQDSDTFLVLPP
jgi:hypothetical protein